MKKLTPDYSVISLGKYTTPEILEVRNKEWILYGKDNDYFQYLIDRYTGSTTNNAIINGISKMIYGRGLSAKDASRRPNAYAQMLSLFKKKDLRKFIFDYKMLGMAAFQVSKIKGVVKEVTHFPMNTLRAGKMNEEGVIENWFYHPKWSEQKQSDVIESIDSFGFGKDTGNEIYVLRPYIAGFDYYTPVDYVGSLPYAFLEQEIADYLINDTINGFSGTRVINFNNGIPDEEKRKQIKKDIDNKTTGAHGLKNIISFNANKESETTIQDVALNDAPSHYEYLSKECRDKLIVGHRVTSPMLIGVRETGGGLGNNADEIKTANLLFDNVVINTYQDQVTEVIAEILSINDISLDLYFKTLEPLEFSSGVNPQNDVNMSAESPNFSDDDGDKMLNNLDGEEITDEWELVDKRISSDDNENIEDWAKKHIKTKQNLMQKFANVIKSNPNASSTLDKDIYKVRYEYNEKYSSGKSRDFCNQMMNRTGRGVVYRKEDIDQASFRGINKEFGHKKQSYSLFKFKGGVNCGHFWNENLYRLKKKTDGTPFVDKALSSSEEVNSIKGYKPKPKGLEDAKKAPKDMPNNGHHPNYKG
jgi:hypothetical protein